MTRDEERQHTNTGGMPRQESSSYLLGLALDQLEQTTAQGFITRLWDAKHSKNQNPVQVAAGAAFTFTMEVLPYLHHGGPAGPYMFFDHPRPVLVQGTA